jgi:hypothetical protein
MIQLFKNIKLLTEIKPYSYFFKFAFESFEKLFDYVILKKIFYNRLGYELDLKKPITFNQKINWLKLNNHNPIFPVLADKYLVRSFLESKLGPELSKKILMPMILVTDDPHKIDFNALPERFIVKATNGSGTNVIVREKNSETKKIVLQKTSDWLKRSYGLFKHEWHYFKIDTRIMIEELLLDESGKLPKDYKFFVFHGKCQFIQVNYDRFVNHKRTIYDSDWNRLDLSYQSPQGPTEEKPGNLIEMINIVEKISEDLDFSRVDLYSLDDKIYFGEITLFPGSGFEVFTPLDFDYKFGSYLNIKS